ncbi:hypothetical protein [Nocardia sp. NPDC046763]|uniref:hypothetical protein n=1 Tax=Nocardia sp. NPDC046763 TaxID=3155256 RepID=UPI0034060B29
MSTGKRVKLALGSGGARGYAHIGVIAELRERTDVAQRAIDLMLAALTRQHLAAHPPDLVIEVPQNICGTMDFHRATPIIERGRLLAAQALDALPDRALDALPD